MLARLDEALRQRFLRGHRFGRKTLVVEQIRERSERADVERQGAALRERQDRRLRPRRVPDAELVIDVGVEQGQVGDRIIAEQDALEHELVDEAGALLLVGADAVQPRRFDRRRHDFGIDMIEIDHSPSRVRLASERHDDEAYGAKAHGGFPGGSRDGLTPI